MTLSYHQWLPPLIHSWIYCKYNKKWAIKIDFYYKLYTSIVNIVYENSSNQYIRSSLNVIRIFDRSGQFVCLLFHYNFTFSLIIDDYFVKSEYFSRKVSKISKHRSSTHTSPGRLLRLLKVPFKTKQVVYIPSLLFA